MTTAIKPRLRHRRSDGWWQITTGERDAKGAVVPPMLFPTFEEARRAISHPDKLDEQALERIDLCIDSGMTFSCIAREGGINPNRVSAWGRRRNAIPLERAASVLAIKPKLSRVQLMRLEWMHFRQMGLSIDEARTHLMRAYGWDEESLKRVSRSCSGGL